jgi:hypothetical protein
LLQSHHLFVLLALFMNVLFEIM